MRRCTQWLRALFCMKLLFSLLFLAVTTARRAFLFLCNLNRTLLHKPLWQRRATSTSYSCRLARHSWSLHGTAKLQHETLVKLMEKWGCEMFQARVSFQDQISKLQCICYTSTSSKWIISYYGIWAACNGPTSRRDMFLFVSSWIIWKSWTQNNISLPVSDR